jgi:Zn-dependent protease with chaperone function
LSELLAALPEKIEPVRRSRAFWLRLLLGVFVLLSLLVVYVALVVITSYGAWSHLASDALTAAVRRLFVNPVAYAAFCVAGPILCVFLVKPVLTMSGSKRSGVKLDRSVETSLFAYVDRLCALQAAPAPRQIRVDTDINASAGLRHGLISLFRDDLALSIGLPLVRAMTLREFTGVLAHEFGHFAHGGAMRLDYLIRMVIHFLRRIAYERDGFDEALVEASRLFLDIEITGVLWLFALFMLGVQGFLWLARMLMRGMAWVGLAASGALLREMEYDADRHEARVAGGESFAVTMDKLTMLNAARQAALSLQEQWWQSRRLADDVPTLVMAVAKQIEDQPEVVQKIRKTAMEATTGRFDTHPALRDRLASVAREAEPGAITLDAPASALFRDIEGLCKAATLAQYHDLLGFSIKNAVLIPVAELLNEYASDRGASERLARFTQGCPVAVCGLKLCPPDPATPDGTIGPEEAVRQLRSTRQRVLDLSPEAIESVRRLEEARDRHARLDLDAALIRASLPVRAPSAGLETAVEAKRQAAIEVHSASRELVPFSEALSDRLRVALRLRQAPHLAAALRQIPGAVDPSRCRMLATTLAALDASHADRDRLRTRLALLLGILQRVATEPSSRLIYSMAGEVSEEIRKILKTIRDALDAVPHPFSTAVKVADETAGSVTIGVQVGSV